MSIPYGLMLGGGLLSAGPLAQRIVMSIPYGLMLGAVYYLLAPSPARGRLLPTTALWLLVEEVSWPR